MGLGRPEAPPLEQFLAIGLDKRTAENALVNQKVTSNLLAVIKEVFNLAMLFT
jgi:glutaminyl-tRNA synthetase